MQRAGCRPFVPSCEWVAFPDEHMGSFGGQGLFLLILTAVELTVVISADCLAELLCTLDHA